jgi:hypothetical protein
MRKKWILYRGQYLTRVQYARLKWRERQEKKK